LCWAWHWADFLLPARLGFRFETFLKYGKSASEKSKFKRYTATFFGGFIILFASRLAGGCTLGLFISGSTQLAVSGLYFGGLIFAFAMLTARIVYGSIAKEEK
jgi:hypothetical protein